MVFFFVEPKWLNSITAQLPRPRDWGLCVKAALEHMSPIFRCAPPRAGRHKRQIKVPNQSVVSNCLWVMWLFGCSFATRKHFIRSSGRQELSLQWFTGKTNKTQNLALLWKWDQKLVQCCLHLHLCCAVPVLTAGCLPSLLKYDFFNLAR